MKFFTQLGTPVLAIALMVGAQLPAFADDVAPAPASAPAADGDKGHHAMTPEEKAAWDAMTPEQKKAKMDAIVAAKEAKMTPDQKAAFEAKRAKWEAMTPEQRKAAHEAHRGSHKKQGHS